MAKTLTDFKRHFQPAKDSFFAKKGKGLGQFRPFCLARDPGPKGRVKVPAFSSGLFLNLREKG